MKNEKRQIILFYEQGIRDGASIVLKALDELIPSYLTDIWKRELILKTQVLKRILNKKKN